MAAANAPITIEVAFALPSIGINPQFINFTHVTMESDKYICVRETAPHNSVVIIDMSMPYQPLRRPITADSALMNPNSRIIALKAQLPGTTQDNMDIYSSEMSPKMKSHQMPEQIVFWKWVTPKMLGLVTQTSVYHWSIEGDSEPVKMFDRTANLASSIIINYRCDPAEKWLVLIGLAPGSPERPQLMKGNMQLFSVDYQRSQAVEAHAVSFATFKVPGNENPSTLICFVSKTLNAGQVTSKLHVIEPGAQPGKPTFTKKQADLLFPHYFEDDFPVAMQISHKYGLIYVIAKLGHLFVYDLETATAVYQNRISLDPIILTSEASSVGGFYAVNKRGQVLLATVNEETIVPFVSGQVVQRFQELFSQTKYKEAVELAAESPQGILRTPDIVAKFLSCPVQTGQPPLLLQYFRTLLTRGKLNAFESLELSRLAVNQNKMYLVENWLAEDKLECSEELGDIVKTMDDDLALKIYDKARATPKVGYTPDYLSLLQTTILSDPQSVVQFFGTLSAERALKCMKDLLLVNLSGNLQIVVQTAKEYSGQMGVDSCIKLFEQFKSYEGLYLFLGSSLSSSEDPEIHSKYIEAAAKTGQIKEVERVTRESNFYDAEKTKNFLMEAKLPDARPLFNVCDRFNFVPDLTHYLYTNNMLPYIEQYVQKVNPGNAALVVGQLIDDECPVDFIKGLILSVRSLLLVEPLAEECEKRNCLALLGPPLVRLVEEGSQDVHVHNTLGKLIVDNSNNPEHFLTINPYYDSRVVGKYCEKRDPTLAVVAYRRGQCYNELVNLTNKNSLLKLQEKEERLDDDADEGAKSKSFVEPSGTIFRGKVPNKLERMNQQSMQQSNARLYSVEMLMKELASEKGKRYSFDELATFTSDFGNEIGSGAFGNVYKGQFSDGTEVAIKVLKMHDVVHHSFLAEIRTMGKTDHQNLIKLIGYCLEENMLALLYEYMENGSFDMILYKKHLTLEWDKLYTIASQLANALAYLHHDCEYQIIHHDIKASNVLLDSNYLPKLSDFGLANLMGTERTHLTLTTPGGTRGYAAPEIWSYFSPITCKCDVYSFGMLLFEILGMERNNRTDIRKMDTMFGSSDNWFPSHVWKKFNGGTLDDLMTECGISEKDKKKALILSLVALWCAQFTPQTRPSMSMVATVLKNETLVNKPPNPFLASDKSDAMQPV